MCIDITYAECNMVAALKCRQRKKQWLNELQAKADYLAADNEQLQMHVCMLRDEVISLRQMLYAHRECPVTKQQQQQRAAHHHHPNTDSAAAAAAAMVNMMPPSPVSSSQQPQQAAAGAPQQQQQPYADTEYYSSFSGLLHHQENGSISSPDGLHVTTPGAAGAGANGGNVQVPPQDKAVLISDPMVLSACMYPSSTMDV